MEGGSSGLKKIVNRKLIFGMVFLLLGFFLLQHVFTGECSLGAIEAGALGQSIEITLPPLLERWVCNATTFPNIFIWLAGVACIFPGIGGIFKGLTKD